MLVTLMPLAIAVAIHKPIVATHQCTIHRVVLLSLAEGKLKRGGGRHTEHICVSFRFSCDQPLINGACCCSAPVTDTLREEANQSYTYRAGVRWEAWYCGCWRPERESAEKLNGNLPGRRDNRNVMQFLKSSHRSSRWKQCHDLDLNLYKLRPMHTNVLYFTRKNTPMFMGQHMPFTDTAHM